MSQAVTGLRRRCDWYDYEVVHPTKRFLYWAYRHLRKVPHDWREYYRVLLRQETFAYRNVNTNWDQFGAIVEGYRKAEWVLRKYGKEPEKDSIPHPFKDFYKNTTADEKCFAWRRSAELKELQALQRNSAALDGQTTAYGQIPQSRTGPMSNVLGLHAGVPMSAKDGRGHQIHAEDMFAPRDNPTDIRDEEETWMNVTSGIDMTEDNNPILKLRRQKDMGQQQLMDIGFEDEE